MSAPIQIITDKIHIRSIKILSGNINANSNIKFDRLESFEVQYGISDEFSYENRIFRFVFSTRINAFSKKESEVAVSGEYNLEFIFYVENLDYYIIDEDGENNNITLHEMLIHTLLSIIYSTSRGIILSRTQGTLMDGIILPVIDTKSLMQSLQESRKLKKISNLNQ